MQCSSYGMSVRVNGRALKEFPHNDDIWIEGRKGSEFTIRVNNDSARRILVVLSIDGLSIMDGKDASKESGGYVIEPHQTTTIPGWRLNDTEIAKFKFHKAARSYAAQTDRPANVGVIGCVIFQSKVEEFTKGSIVADSYKPRHRPCSRRRRVGAGGQSIGHGAIRGIEDRAVPCSDRSEERNMNFAPSLGTEFGRRDRHRTRTTTFEKASNTPDVTFKLRYADQEELKKRGVDMDTRPVTANPPDPFPADQGCAPPEGWRG